MPASASAAAEACAPTLTALEAPERERARIAPVSSIRTHSVLVPPPSKPRTHFIREAYVKPSRRCGGSRQFKPKTNLGLTGPFFPYLVAVKYPISLDQAHLTLRLFALCLLK